jgi:plastocyanin
MIITNRSRSRWAGLVVAAGLAALAGRAHAQGSEAADGEEMRREIRGLKAQLQTLRSAMGEAAEFDRMRANALARALGTGPATSESAAPPVKERSLEPPRRPATSRSSPGPAAQRRAQVAAPEPAGTGTGTLRGRVEVPGGEPVAYVYVENIHGPAVRNELKKIEQLNKQFVPPWAVVQRGTTLQFPNLDNIYHNVFSLSSGNTFDLGLYNSAGEPKTHVFDEAGAVDIYCNIHPQMAASVLVVPNRFFSRVKSDGTFEITGVPSGRRKVVAWSPGSRLVADWVEVPVGSSADVALKLEPKTSSHRNKQGRPYGSYE